MDRLIFHAPERRRIYDWLFVAVALFVIVFKFNDLFLPYFWDELGVYTQAANYQYLHGLSLMPSSVPPEFSRGHPLLFTFLNALVLKVFSNTVFVAHFFSLFVSLLLLLVVYLKTIRYFSPLAAIVSVVLIAAQPVFLAQSCLVLPEIMLALFVLLSLTSYYEGKYFQFALFASMAILTKESAIVLPVTVLTYSLVQLVVFKYKSGGLKAGNIIFTLLPYVVFGIFLLIQKQQNGWYFFPFHIKTLTFDLPKFQMQFSEFFNFIFWKQGRYWCEKIIFVGIGVSLFTHKLNWHSAGRSFLTLTGIFILIFFLFSSISFYMDRYVMAVLFPAFMVVAVSLTNISTNKIFIVGVSLFLCFVGYEHLEDGSFNYDSDLGYRRQVHVLQQAVDYVSEVSMPGETVNGNFPSYLAFDFVSAGYLQDKKMAARKVFGMNVDYFLLSDPGSIFNLYCGKYDFTELKDFKDGFAQVKIYKVRERE